ncbi:MAG: periplasmic heavy metal sensor [Candidatus Omnitrophica bacterium]|nr:periplasmic heavy metal sensor [Candidatus Omnitrophota bacterium]
MKLRKIALFGIAVTFFLSSAICAQAYHGEKEGAGECNVQEKHSKLTEELGLTPEQETRLKEDRRAFMEKNKELGKKMRSKRKELKGELEKPAIDTTRVGKIINDIKELTGEKLQNRVNKIVSMKSTLTPEQCEKLQSKMKKKYRSHKRSNKNGHKSRHW